MFFNNKFPFIIVLLFTAALSTDIYTQLNTKNTLEIFETEISSELEKIFLLPEIDREQKFIFLVSTVKNSAEDKKFITQVIRKTADKNKLNYSIAKDENFTSPDTAYYKFSISIGKLRTEYTKFIKNGFLGEKTMRREISSLLNIKIRNKDDEEIFTEEIKTGFADEILYDGYSRYESKEYKFTQSIPPDISFLESIIFPAAVITASAVAAILFFTIRSK